MHWKASCLAFTLQLCVALGKRVEAPTAALPWPLENRAINQSVGKGIAGFVGDAAYGVSSGGLSSALSETRSGFLSRSSSPPKLQTPGSSKSFRKSASSQSAQETGGEDESFFGVPLPGAYCKSVVAPERLPTRTVVIGGTQLDGSDSNEFFDLMNGKSLETQKRLLEERAKSSLTNRKPSASHSSPLLLGCLHPVAVQTMTNSDTRDVDATVQQESLDGALCFSSSKQRDA